MNIVLGCVLLLTASLSVYQFVTAERLQWFHWVALAIWVVGIVTCALYWTLK